ncbi:hypothetical protein C8F04DRAFT_1192797 [Mycena alexandri]|uniref:Uncharacterized protein n=1 Tax=Mycena alexandri TaxID=1745969 RepID=A0AAD6SAR8_9AGAR|nr:hypothetical protein C8F04DRAFT_1192797 [Mycena alexandri]
MTGLQRRSSISKDPLKKVCAARSFCTTRLTTIRDSARTRTSFAVALSRLRACMWKKKFISCRNKGQRESAAKVPPLPPWRQLAAVLAALWRQFSGGTFGSQSCSAPVVWGLVKGVD